MKDIINMTILISTNDGGVADLDPPSVLTVVGDTYQEEVVSLYSNMRIACAAVRDETKWAAEVTRQISGYLPIICGSRMIRDYLRFLFKTN
jgi:hypothetical protein